VTVAIFGLVGVVVGGLVSWAATYALARRDERRNARASARLLEIDLRRAVAILALVLDWVEYRNHRAEQERERADDKETSESHSRVLQAIRSATSEREVIYALWDASPPPRPPDRPFSAISTARWVEHQGRLAETLDGGAWKAVSQAYARIEELQWSENQTMSTLLSDEVRFDVQETAEAFTSQERVKKGADAVRGGLAALEKLASR
jgi:hypothetical protein